MFDKAKRSEIMSRVRSKETGAEKIAFRYLRQQKIYFQKHYKRAPGTPDIALPRKKKAVFIDSDFWHGRKYDVILRNRPPGDYWVKKIAKNMERDRVKRGLLVEGGWRIIVVWEDEIKQKKSQAEALNRIKKFLTEVN